MIAAETKQILLGVYPAELVGAICEDLQTAPVYCGRLRHKLYPRANLASTRCSSQITSSQISVSNLDNCGLSRLKKKCLYLL